VIPNLGPDCWPIPGGSSQGGPYAADQPISSLIAQARVEALDVAVLPRTAPLDIGGLGADSGIQAWTASATNSGPLSARM
jgi:hypothetical protein